MKIEIPDLEEIYYSDYEYEEITGKDLKRIIADIAISKFIDKMYDNYMNDKVYETIRNDAKKLLKFIPTRLLTGLLMKFQTK